MASNTLSAIDKDRCLVPNPFLTCAGLDSIGGIVDALDNAVCTLDLLSDLFGGEIDGYRYPILENEKARRGMFSQLSGLSELLEHVGKAVAKKAESELTIQFSESELVELRKVAAMGRRSVNSLVQEVLSGYCATLRAAFGPDRRTTP